MPNPISANSKIGRLPYLSLSAPMKGEKKNIIKAYANVSQLPYFAATVISPPVSCLIRPGRTGIMIPNPITSISIVININPSAALRLTVIS